MSVVELGKNRLKELAKLTQKKYRETERKVIVEGKRTLEQLAGTGILPQEVYTVEPEEIHGFGNGIPVFKLAQHDLDRLCDTRHPQRVAALYAMPKPSTFTFWRAFYLDGIGDPGNLGTIFRVASAFGFDGVLLSSDCCEAMSPKTIRASMGAVFQIPWRVTGTADLKALSAQFVCADMAGTMALTDYLPPEKGPVIIAVGSEAHGLSADIKATADVTLRVEMKTGMESLNAAVAAGIIAHHVWSRGSHY